MLINRREFIISAGAALFGVRFPFDNLTCSPYTSEAPPTSWGRIATWWRQAVRTAPDPDAEWVAWKRRDDVIPLYAALEGVAPWPTNSIWYQTEGGYIHSGYVQPVEDAPHSAIETEVLEPGFWGQVCVPITKAYWRVTSARPSYKLYYGTVYRVVDAVADEAGQWWYQLKEGLTYAPGPYVPAHTIRRIPPAEVAPISPGRDDKWIEINIDEQTLTCLEGEQAVFHTRIASGLPATATPRGEFTVLYKRHTQRMIGGGEDDYYDLPGIAFPVYFTWSGVAIHGTYWHNDYGRRHSHGCVNVTHQAAQWIFRWVDPIATYGAFRINAEDNAGTRVVVV
jgi:lipoprotein-anchoring transpeptidase ErfK/SrfK